jgi:hypothetical protein
VTATGAFEASSLPLYFSKSPERVVGKLFEADRALCDARPDDRIVMEELILTLTAA